MDILKVNLIQGLKTIHNMKVDLRAYGAQVKAGQVNLPDCLAGIHEAIMDAARQLAEAGEGRTPTEVLLAYIDSATKI